MRGEKKLTTKLSTVEKIAIGAGVWSVGIYAYQSTFGVIVSNGQTVIPGFLDPLGMILGYPGQVTVQIGEPTEVN